MTTFFAGLGSGLDAVEVEEVYEARAREDVAKRIADTDNPFRIEVRFLGGLTEEQKQAFRTAADRWAEVIVGDLEDVELPDGTTVDDVRIDAAGVSIDGPGRVLGRAGPRLVRPAGSTHEFLPITGGMEFDVDDIPTMMAQGLWDIVIMHEMGHVIGMLDFVWSAKGFVANRNTPQWSFTGPTAMAEFGRLQDPCAGVRIADLADLAAAVPGGDGAGVPVPIEDDFGPGTIGSHWRESVFGAEMMTGFVNQGANPLSRVTGGALQDLGYQVDLDACDDYSLPSPTSLAVMGVLTAGRMHEVIGEIGGTGGYVEHPTPEVAPDSVLRR
ncbi:Leishmanolysin [Geodermatophilus saharensis]|uniref:Leishmanolysin n=1 Tax=Geodermatophilus saharensis TaxID=1137994 RepID=A0A239D2W1_9ACTN|nr:leishmanolysin-related zinc metalloendopeptidase [Geodermatophilus saharensis]SNS26637.1 Leishmanolysin [Geodermatophilus saharensis]